MSLPQKLDLPKMQTTWAGQIDPVLNNPLNQGLLLKNISLKSGDNTVNTTLGRQLQGWYIVRQRGPASVYDKQDSNQMPNLTLVLNSSANVVIDLAVF